MAVTEMILYLFIYCFIFFSVADEGSPLSARLAAEALVLLSENVTQQNCHKKPMKTKQSK
jgi:hypothetical protein